MVYFITRPGGQCEATDAGSRYDMVSRVHRHDGINNTSTNVHSSSEISTGFTSTTENVLRAPNLNAALSSATACAVARHPRLVDGNPDIRLIVLMSVSSLTGSR